MRRLLALLFSLVANTALAQNVQCPTRPAGDNTNACASTAFVQQNPVVTIAAFGGKCDNIVDNTTPLNNALASLTGTGGNVLFPPGKCRFNSGITFNYPAGIFSVGLFGSGQDATILTWPNASGGITFNYNGTASSSHIRDLSFTTGTTTGGNAINLQLSASIMAPFVTADSDIYRVTIRGDDGYAVTDYWTNCVNIGNVSNVQIESLSCQGPATPNGNGVSLIGLPGMSTFGVVYDIGKSTFNNLAQGVVYGSFIQGVTIDQTNFTSNNGTSSGVVIPAAQSGVLDQLSITNSQFNVPTNAVSCGTAIAHLQFSNNLIFSRANSTGLNCGGAGFGASNYTITGSVFAGQSVTGTTAVSINNSFGTISANVISLYGTGLSFGAAANNATVSGNTFTSNTAAITNASVNQNIFIVNNVGYNPVGTSTGTYAPATTATYTAGSSPETDYLTGGAVTAVKIPNNAGTTICTTTPCTLDLGPFETFSVTYTGAPTQTKSIH